MKSNNFMQNQTPLGYLPSPNLSCLSSPAFSAMETPLSYSSQASSFHQLGMSFIRASQMLQNYQIQQQQKLEVLKLIKGKSQKISENEHQEAEQSFLEMLKTTDISLSEELSLNGSGSKLPQVQQNTSNIGCNSNKMGNGGNGCSNEKEMNFETYLKAPLFDEGIFEAPKGEKGGNGQEKEDYLKLGKEKNGENCYLKKRRGRQILQRKGSSCSNSEKKKRKLSKIVEEGEQKQNIQEIENENGEKQDKNGENCAKNQGKQDIFSELFMLKQGLRNCLQNEEKEKEIGQEQKQQQEEESSKFNSVTNSCSNSECIDIDKLKEEQQTKQIEKGVQEKDSVENEVDQIVLEDNLQETQETQMEQEREKEKQSESESESEAQVHTETIQNSN